MLDPNGQGINRGRGKSNKGGKVGDASVCIQHRWFVRDQVSPSIIRDNGTHRASGEFDGAVERKNNRLDYVCGLWLLGAPAPCKGAQ